MPKVEDEIKAVETKVSAEVAAIHAKIDAWFVKHFHGNRISQDTDSFNICHAAKEDLKTIVAPVAAPQPAKTAE